MKLYLIDNGRIIMKNGNQVTTDTASGGEDPYIPIPCYLFETEKGYVLFDTGCDPEGMEKNWPANMCANPYVCPPEQALLHQLSLARVTPADIRYVVLSHLHVDHAGGLKFFPNAQIIVSGAEFSKTMHAYADRDFSGFHLQSDIESWLRAELRWRLLEEERLQLTEDITVLNLGPGHSYGMLGLLVKTKAHGMLLLPADACYTQAHFDSPDLVAGIVYDEAGYCATVRALRRMAEEFGATVWFGHDPAQFQTLKKLPDGFYE